MKFHGQSKREASLAQGKRIRRGFGLLGAALAVMLLNGCASVGSSEASDLYQYNPNTGYPAVGGPSWGRL